jgi:hypothetical protein
MVIAFVGVGVDVYGTVVEGNEWGRYPIPCT